MITDKILITLLKNNLFLLGHLFFVLFLDATERQKLYNRNKEDIFDGMIFFKNRIKVYDFFFGYFPESVLKDISYLIVITGNIRIKDWEAYYSLLEEAKVNKKIRLLLFQLTYHRIYIKELNRFVKLKQKESWFFKNKLAQNLVFTGIEQANDGNLHEINLNETNWIDKEKV